MEIIKQEVGRLINEWQQTDNLFFLADALFLIDKALKLEEFPTENYKIWKNQ